MASCVRQRLWRFIASPIDSQGIGSHPAATADSSSSCRRFASSETSKQAHAGPFGRGGREGAAAAAFSVASCAAPARLVVGFVETAEKVAMNGYLGWRRLSPLRRVCWRIGCGATAAQQPTLWIGNRVYPCRPGQRRSSDRRHPVRSGSFRARRGHADRDRRFAAPDASCSCTT